MTYTSQSYWDIDYYGGETSSKLKELLINQGTYDDNLDSVFQKKWNAITERKAKKSNKPEVIAYKLQREEKKQVKMAEHRLRMGKRFSKQEANKIEMNYFQADFEFLGWKPLDDAKCDLTGEQGICLRPNIGDYDELFKGDFSEQELKDLVEQNKQFK